MTLRTRVAIGLGWTGAAHWIGLLLATMTTMVVARFLVPADYAVVAAAGVLAGVVGVLQESGWAPPSCTIPAPTSGLRRRRSC